MKKVSAVFSICCVAVPVFRLSPGSGPSAPQDLSSVQGQEPPMLGIVWARGFNQAGRASDVNARPARSPLMTYHGGKIMTTAVTKNIFWGPSWTNANFVSDKITGLDSWYVGFSNSNSAKTSDE